MPTVQLYADDRPIRRSTPKALASRGRNVARAAMRAYGKGDYAEAARLAWQCVGLARRIGAEATVKLWTERAEAAERSAAS